MTDENPLDAVKALEAESLETDDDQEMSADDEGKLTDAIKRRVIQNTQRVDDYANKISNLSEIIVRLEEIIEDVSEQAKATRRQTDPGAITKLLVAEINKPASILIAAGQKLTASVEKSTALSSSVSEFTRTVDNTADRLLAIFGGLDDRHRAQKEEFKKSLLTQRLIEGFLIAMAVVLSLSLYLLTPIAVLAVPDNDAQCESLGGIFEARWVDQEQGLARNGCFVFFPSAKSHQSTVKP